MNVVCHFLAHPALLPSVSPPDSGRADVWIAQVPDDWTAPYELLDKDECARAATLQDPHARQRFVVGRVILRRILAHCCGVTPQQVVVSRDDRGKPWLAYPDSELYFSVSYTRALVAIAVMRGRRVGIDVEWIDPDVPLERLAPQALSAYELARWQDLTANEQRCRFFQHWTCKEAVLKAIGTGLHVAPDSFSVVASSNNSWRVYSKRGRHHSWVIQSLDLTQGYMGSVAMEVTGMGLRRQAQRDAALDRAVL